MTTKEVNPSLRCQAQSENLLLSLYLTSHARCSLDIYLQAEEAPVVSCGDSRRGLEPFAGFPQQVA